MPLRDLGLSLGVGVDLKYYLMVFVLGDDLPPEFSFQYLCYSRS
jgi:hypothetical protein